jgi:succinoglycan biosynthesis protein ExoM
MLERQRRTPDFDFEVIVIDNDEEYSAEEIVRDFQVRGAIPIHYGREPERNISLARNRAVHRASGNLVAFIDDDEAPVSEWLLHLHGTLTRWRADGVLGPVLPEFPDDAPEWVRRGSFFTRRRLPTGARISSEDARTGNVLLRRSMFVDDGDWFDPAYGRTGGEDSDFFARQFRRGRLLLWNDEAIVYEVVPSERWSAAYHIKRYLRSGTLDGERIRAGVLEAQGLVLRSALVGCACLTVAPFLPVLRRGFSIQVLRKLAYCSGVVAAYWGLSLLRERD